LLLISRGNAIAVDGAADVSEVAPIVRACLERAADAIHDKRLKLVVDLDERQPPRAPHASDGAVGIIIRNLIDNAVQYTPAEGRIAIRIEGTGNGSRSLVVENDPVALAADDLPRLFEPFWRRDGSRSDRQHAGLGLTVVQQIGAVVGLRVDAALSGDRLQMRVTHAAQGDESCAGKSHYRFPIRDATVRER
jgi:signal transduction histidine kinase